MRIIGGKYKRLSLAYPKNRSFRPTQDKVRESLFNIIRQRLSGSRLLDLCAGTGAIAIEALSEGALSVVAVDIDTTYLSRNRATLLRHDPALDPEAFTVCRSSCLSFLKRRSQDQFDIIFFDPPWDKAGLYADSLKLISEFDILNETGILICEHHKSTRLPGEALSTYQYGDTILSLYNKEGLKITQNPVNETDKNLSNKARMT